MTNGAIIGFAALVLAADAANADITFGKDGVSVSLYGILDVGVGSLEHSYGSSATFVSGVNPYNLNSSPNSYTGLFGSGISMSRIGIKGEADLGNDWKAFFKLESAVNVLTGELSNNGKSLYNDINGLQTANGASAIDGQPFQRAAYAGISHKEAGSLEFGRTTNLSLDQVAQYDPVQSAYVFSPLGFSGGIGGGLGATENTRFDNSVKYENKVGAVEFGAQYKFSGSKNDQSAGTAYVFMLGFTAGDFSAKGTYSQTSNTVAWATQYSNVVAPDPNVQIEDTKGFMLTSMYRINPDATVKIGYEYATVSAPSNTSFANIVSYYGLTLPSPAVNASGQQHFGTFWAGGDYKFTKVFDLGVGYFNINTDNSPEVNKEYRAEAYSVLADYNFTPSFDAYAAIMAMSYSGIGLDKKLPTQIYSSNAMYGVGIRFKF